MTWLFRWPKHKATGEIVEFYAPQLLNFASDLASWWNSFASGWVIHMEVYGKLGVEWTTHLLSTSVGWFNVELVGKWSMKPISPLKNISQNGNLPQVGVKIKNVWNRHLDFWFPNSQNGNHFPKEWWTSMTMKYLKPEVSTLKMMVFQGRNLCFPEADFQVDQPLNFRGTVGNQPFQSHVWK